ncbi:lysine transporter LysE [Streptomyces sp. G45]|uniref:lysine transporter LysE n=1 Tax=Streptomyces sp. G45 TaxID=3406627 RepID=UPI003C15F9BC
MTGNPVAGLLAGYGIAMPVEPVAAYLLALTARTSWRTGACAALGVATADGLYALVAVAASATAASVITPLKGPLRWVRAGVLVALAVRAATTAVRHYRAPEAATPGDGGATVIPFAALAALAASASWQFPIAGGGALLGRALTGARGRIATALASSAVIAAHLLASAP